MMMIDTSFFLVLIVMLSTLNFLAIAEICLI